MLLGQEAAAVLAVLFAIALLHYRTGAGAADFGWSPKHLAADVRVVAEDVHCFVDRAVSRLTDTPLWRFEAMSLARYGDLSGRANA